MDNAQRFHDDLIATLEDLTEALQKQRPEVNVTTPSATPPKVDVRVDAPPAPNVTVEAAKVRVPAAKPSAFTVEITERDSHNFIKRLKITPA